MTKSSLVNYTLFIPCYPPCINMLGKPCNLYIYIYRRFLIGSSSCWFQNFIWGLWKRWLPRLLIKWWPNVGMQYAWDFRSRIWTFSPQHNDSREITRYDITEGYWTCDHLYKLEDGIWILYNYISEYWKV